MNIISTDQKRYYFLNMHVYFVKICPVFAYPVTIKDSKCSTGNKHDLEEMGYVRKTIN